VNNQFDRAGISGAGSKSRSVVFQNSTMSASGLASSVTGQSSAGRKWAGLIEYGIYKTFLRRMQMLMNYLDVVSPTFPTVNLVVTLFRLTQFLGPCLCAGYEHFWKSDDKSKGILEVISVLWHLLPPDAMVDYGWYFNVIASILIFFTIVVFITSSIVVEKTASLPGFVPPFLTVWMSACGFLLHPISLSISAGQFSLFVAGLQDPSTAALVLFWAGFAVVCSLIYMFFYCQIIAPTLLFRPTSLLTTCNQPAALFFSVQGIINVFIGFGEFQGKTVRMICLGVSTVLYFLSVQIDSIYGGFVFPFRSLLYCSCAQTGSIMTAVMFVLVVIDQQATLLILFLFIVIFVGVMIVMKFVNDWTHRRHIAKLDAMMDDPENMESITSANQFVNLCIDGFRIGHPVCLDWSFPKWGVERWPTHQMPWFIFAKFVAIFPEQSQTLSWIYRQIVANKVKGTSAHTIKAQSMSIARQCESNLGPELKNRLKSFSKTLTTTKHKLRRVWDLAIQGNILDMDDATKTALATIEHCEASMRHICREFPNNRFVTRQYARLAEEVLADRDMAVQMIEKSRLLQRGIQVNNDQAHEWGTIAFPNLPETTTVERPNAQTESVSIDVAELDQETEQQGTADQAIIAARINELSFPGIRKSIIIQLVLFIAFQCLEIPIMLIVSLLFKNQMLTPLDFFHNQAKLFTESYVLRGLSQQFIYTHMTDPGRTPLPTPPMMPSATHLEKIWGDWDLKSQIIFWVRELSVSIQDVSMFRTFSTNDKNLRASQACLFQTTTKYYYYTDGVEHESLVSVPVGLVNCMGNQADLAQMQTVTLGILNDSMFLNPSRNISNLAPVVKQSLNYLVSYITSLRDRLALITQVIGYVSMVVAGILFLGSQVIETIWVRGNKERVYTTLISIPKNHLTAMVENLHLHKNEHEDGPSTTNTESNRQEDNIVKAFLAGGGSILSRILD
jgi:hypothetical protein